MKTHDADESTVDDDTLVSDSDALYAPCARNHSGQTSSPARAAPRQSDAGAKPQRSRAACSGSKIKNSLLFIQVRKNGCARRPSEKTNCTSAAAATQMSATAARQVSACARADARADATTDRARVDAPAVITAATAAARGGVSGTSGAPSSSPALDSLPLPSSSAGVRTADSASSGSSSASAAARASRMAARNG